MKSVFRFWFWERNLFLLWCLEGLHLLVAHVPAIALRDFLGWSLSQVQSQNCSRNRGSAQWRILSSQIEPAISLSQRPLGIQQIRQDHPRCQTSFDRLTWTGWGRGAHRDVHGWRLPRSWDWRHWDCGVAESVAWKERWPVWNQVVYRVYALYFKFNFGLFRDLIVSAAPARYATCVLHGTQRREMVFFLRPLLQVGCSMACGKPVSCLCLLAGRTESLDDGESRRQHWGWRYLLFKSGCLERGLVFSLRKYPFPSFNDP